MTTLVELATAPSADSPQTCVYVRHPKGTYFFGRVAEGSQRALSARKVSFAGTSQIFLTGPTGWEQVGGLLGMLLSLASAATASRDSDIAANTERERKGLRMRSITAHSGVGVHAGDNISHFLASSRAFIFRQPLSIRVHEHRDDARAGGALGAIETPDWQDDQIRVWRLPTDRARSSSPPKRRRLSSGEPDGTPKEEVLKDSPPLKDHRLAQFIVEQALFNGTLEIDSYLVETTIGALGPDDIALVKGPYGNYRVLDPTQNGASSPKSDRPVWVLRTESYPNSDRPGPLIKHIRIPKTAYSAKSMSYIVKTHDRRGKFDAAAARALNIAKTDYGALTAGQEITTQEGTKVTPDMVMGAPIPGQGFVIADIESHEFLESFMQRPEWKSEELMANITVMYWLLGPNMSDNVHIRKFMDDFKDIKHVICAPDTCPNMLTIDSAAEMQVKLRRVDPERFPILDFDNTVKAPAPPPDSNIEFGRVSQRVQLMPRVLFDDANMAPFPDLVKASTTGWDKTLAALANAAKKAATDPKFLAEVEESEKDIPNRDAQVTCLGTGSSAPSKYRNVSGTLIQVPGIGNYLLDAGEGTLNQIKRLYGAEKTIEILRNLRCIVVSHLHADHHLGVPSVLKAWYGQALQDGNKSNLAVACNPRFREFLFEISQMEDFGFHRLRFPCQPANNEGGRAVDLEVAHFAPGDDDFGLKAIKRIPVQHCHRSMGTELELTSGLRIAYSGDCRPSSDFAQACKGAHLLIHECTFSDDMRSHATAKNHTTLSEALGVSREMGARRTLLTHFSQRYVKANALRLGHELEEGTVLMGFDFMTIKLGDFKKATCYLPALERVLEKLMDKEGYHSA